jgi:hypothetical protein
MATKNTASLRINNVQFGRTLTLQRLPTYLRFVVVGDDWSTLDALDQHDDEPKADETIIAAKQVTLVRAHVLRSPRNQSGWMNQAEYEMCDPQPPAFDLRDTPSWRAWCIEKHRESEAAK